MSTAEARTRTRKRIKLRPRFFIIVTLLFLAFYTLYGYVSGFARMRALRLEIEAVRREIAELEMLNVQLEEQLAYFDSDEVIERIAREQLRLVAPGETPVIVIDAPPAPGADAGQ